MLTVLNRLTEHDLAAVAELEARVVTHDGGRLKLEWPTLRGRSGDQVGDFLWRLDGRVVAFAGIYSFGGSTPEVAGMVDPEFRRRGLGSALVGAARAALAGREQPKLLLVCPRVGAGGAEFAAVHDGRLEHSEHAMTLHHQPPPGPERADLLLRRAQAEDAADIRRILREGFGFDEPEIANRLADPAEDVRVVELGGEVVGHIRLNLVGGRGGVYGFAVDGAHRGRGVGRAVLRRCCADLFDAGATTVGLEVEVENDSALGLYQSVGFERDLTEDYYELRV